MVFVAVTYRLGLLGFLGTEGGTPNLGLLDLLLALRWVQRNVATFGGDPRCVTLLGHSSGADAIAQLLLVPDSADLFRRVILHSAPLGLTRGRQAMTRAMRRAAGPLPAMDPLSDVLAREDDHGFDLVRKPYSAEQVAGAFRKVALSGRLRRRGPG